MVAHMSRDDAVFIWLREGRTGDTEKKGENVYRGPRAAAEPGKTENLAHGCLGFGDREKGKP
jgi:hypothetical protein